MSENEEIMNETENETMAAEVDRGDRSCRG